MGDLALGARHQGADRLAHRQLTVGRRARRRCGATGAAGGNGGLAEPARSTSASVIAPFGPLPETSERSTPSCSAARRASGETRSRWSSLAAAGGTGAGGAVTRNRWRGGCWWRWRGGGRSGRDRGLDADRMKGREHGAHRHPLAHRHQQLVDHPVLEDLHLDLRLAGVHQRDDVAPLDRVAGLDVPLEHRAGLHVGAERGHHEVTHGRPLRSCDGPLRPPFRAAAARPARGGVGRASAPRPSRRARPARRARRTPAP